MYIYSYYLDLITWSCNILRISYGQAARRRGVGSRAVPHRLNAAERKEWDLAKERRYLQLRGTGWRKERGDSPLANIYRNYCDAVAVPCISIRRGVQSGQLLYDELIVDFSPMRTFNSSIFAGECVRIMNQGSSLISIDDSTDISDLGWSITKDVLDNEVIWRLPYYGLSGRYSDRKDCKTVAEAIAVRLCCGQMRRSNDMSDISDEWPICHVTPQDTRPV